MDGLQLLAALGDDLAQLYFVLLTAQGTVETAVDALKRRRRGLPDQAGRSAAPAAPARAAVGAERRAPREQRPAPAAARGGPLRPHGRRQPRDAEGVQRHRAGRADDRLGADHRRVGHRQGAGGADAAPAQPAHPVAVRRDQLRGHSRDAARERDLRPREGRLHRRLRTPRRLLRAGRPRHAVPRRDRRDDAGHAGQAAARAAGARASVASAAAPSRTSTCASSPPPTSIRSAPCAAASCATTSTTG